MPDCILLHAEVRFGAAVLATGPAAFKRPTPHTASAELQTWGAAGASLLLMMSFARRSS